jgi:hypothetical protein
MSTKISFIWERQNAEQPAFPQELPAGNGNTVSLHGLTKRELFAAMAMQGILASETAEDPFTALHTAKRSTALADALLAELAK